MVFTGPPGTYELCPVCGWEDDGVQLANPTSGGGANRGSLVDAQASGRHRDRPCDLPRDESWRPLSTEEITWHRSEREVGGTPWPNRGTDIYYWRQPFERVHTVVDWHDGPVAGVADYQGTPHRFRRRWDADHDEWDDDLFELEPVSSRVLSLEQRLWRMWVRWLDAFDAGRTDRSTHPCLPEDRDAYDALALELEQAKRPSDVSVIARGTFRGDLRRCTDARVRWHPHAAFASGR